MSSVLWLLGTVGINSIGWQGILGLTSIGTIGTAAAISKFKTEREEARKERVNKNFDKMQTDKKEVETKLFDKEKFKSNMEISKQYDQMQVDKKERELNNYRLVEVSCSRYPYNGIKVDNMSHLLIGHDKDNKPIWGKDTNYIIAGSTGCGKTRRIYTLMLNYLANKQGTIYLADLKGTDFKMFKDKKYVVNYCDDLENVAEVVKAFEKEYEGRKALFNEVNALDLDDYNSKADIKLRQFILVIDEYADIADTYKDRYGKPCGVYADLIRLARKCRSFGGRIILGTQRPDAQVVCGQLKNNCTIIGSRCTTVISSQVMIGQDGCERLETGEALVILNGKLTKVFSYDIDNDKLDKYISKLS